MYLKIAIIGLFSLMASTAFGQSFTTGYAAYVVYSDGHSSRPAGETAEACEENRMRSIAAYLEMFPGVRVVESRSLPCGPRTSEIPEFDLEAWNRLPFPPVCLSCPLLGPETFEIYYPDFYSEIKSLYYQFKINSYNKEFRLLQDKYDLESFEKELYHLNQNINKSKQ